MDNPIKIIFKYKNNNRKSQYGLYIFIGDIPNKIYSILKKICNYFMQQPERNRCF